MSRVHLRLIDNDRDRCRCVDRTCEWCVMQEPKRKGTWDWNARFPRLMTRRELKRQKALVGEGDNHGEENGSP